MKVELTTTHTVTVTHRCGHVAHWHGGFEIGVFAAVVALAPCLACGGSGNQPAQSRPVRFVDPKRGWVCEVD